MLWGSDSTSQNPSLSEKPDLHLIEQEGYCKDGSEGTDQKDSGNGSHHNAPEGESGHCDYIANGGRHDVSTGCERPEMISHAGHVNRRLSRVNEVDEHERLDLRDRKL